MPDRPPGIPRQAPPPSPTPAHLEREGAVTLDALLPRLPPSLHERAARVNLRRLARMLDVLDQRTGAVEVVVEAVRRRHNVSAILRSSEAFGIHRVHLVTGDFKPSPGATRGSERWLDLRFHENTSSCVQDLRSRGFGLWIADMVPGALSPEDLPVDRPLAVLFGSELAGVSKTAAGLADGAVQVPMAGFGESLNVSAAAAVILHVVARRRLAEHGPDLDPEARQEALATWIARETTWMAAASVRTRPERSLP